jgi:hypothetical protein
LVILQIDTNEIAHAFKAYPARNRVFVDRRARCHHYKIF